MNIAHQFQKIGVLLTNNGFVPVLKQLTMAAMVPLKAGLKLTAYPVSSRCIKLTSPSGPQRNKKWAWLLSKTQA
jgi:hypothetical protein